MEGASTCIWILYVHIYTAESILLVDCMKDGPGVMLRESGVL